MAKEKKNWDQRLFDDTGRHLDRFGLLLVLSVVTVTVNSLIDLDNPTESLASEVGWVAVSLITGLTLILALRSSGLVRRIRRIAEIAVVIVVGGAILISISEVVGTSVGTGWSGARPSGLWVIVAFASPLVVLRRIFVQDKITKATIYGAISIYLLIAIAFNYAFLSVSSLMSDPFFVQGEQLTTAYMYFSLTTITTLGYGDLAPASELGRFLATGEALVGQVFLVTVVARIVALLGTTRPSEALKPTSD
ncbi:MAG: ion channel [Acidimicrobiia bacterium]